MRGDEWLDAAGEAVSVGVIEMACRLVEGCGFRDAAEHLLRLAQVRLSHETVRGLVEGEGAAVLAAEDDDPLPAGWSAGEALVEGTSITRVYLGVDGVKVPTVTEAEKRKRREAVKAHRRKCGKKRRPLPRLSKGTDQRWKEARLVVHYDQERERRLVSAAVQDAAACGRRMRRDAGRVGLDKADDRLGVFDGADWIRSQAAGQSLPLDGLCLDFFHLAENVHGCRRAVFGDDPDPAGPGMTWAAGVLHAVKHGGFDALRDRLADLRTSVRRSVRKKAAVDRLTDYAAARRDMLDYPLWLECGRDVGSGPTESMCKQLSARLKGAGMRWNVENADALMALTCLRHSGLWTAWWKRRAA